MPHSCFFPIPQPKAMRLLVLTALLPFAAPVARAEDAPDKGGLRDASVTVVAGYIQGTFKARNATFGESQQTDNGHANLNLDYDSHEKAFVRRPMGVGEFIMGWNFNATISQFQVNKQLETSAFTGTDEGTSLKGTYAAVGPSAFIRLGPLYPGTKIFWSFGVGLGVGGTEYSGNAMFGAAPGTILPVKSGGVKPMLYETAFWKLDVGHVMVLFNSKYLLIRDANLQSSTYESYGLSVGYRFTF